MRGLARVGLLLLLATACAQGAAGEGRGDDGKGDIRLRFHGMVEAEVTEVRVTMTAVASPAVTQTLVLLRQPDLSFNQEVTGVEAGTYDIVARAYDSNDDLGFWSEEISQYTVLANQKNSLDLFLFQQPVDPPLNTPYITAVQFAGPPTYEQPVDIRVWGAGGASTLTLSGDGDGAFANNGAEVDEMQGATLTWTPAPAPADEQSIELILDDGEGNSSRIFMTVEVDYARGDLDFEVFFNHAPTLVVLTDIRQVGESAVEFEVDATYGDPDASPSLPNPYSVHVSWKLEDCDNEGLLYVGDPSFISETVDARNEVNRKLEFYKADASTSATCRISVELEDADPSMPASKRSASFDVTVHAIVADVPFCPEGEEPCGGICVDKSVDMNHCGGCNVVCEGIRCDDGVCLEVVDLPRSMGDAHSMALMGHGSVYTWGQSSYDRLGRSVGAPNPPREQPAPMDSPLPGAILDWDVGLGHNCAVMDDNRVVCWGRAHSRALGNGYPNSSKDPVFVRTGSGAGSSDLQGALRIALAGDSACVVMNDETIRCWGDNTSGQLGRNSTADSGSWPVEVVDENDQALQGAVEVSGGFTHFCAVLDDGSAWCWGSNSAGQLGDDQFTDPLGRFAREVTNLGLGVAKIAPGADFTCALMTDGTVRCWGSNAYGQLGDGQQGVNSLVPVQVVGLTQVHSLHAGEVHACVQVQGDTGARCWGRNFYGQLGTGDAGTQSSWEDEPVDVLAEPGQRLLEIEGLSLGLRHSCARLADGSMRCWGQNSGQLGDKTLTGNRPFPVEVQF